MKHDEHRGKIFLCGRCGNTRYTVSVQKSVKYWDYIRRYIKDILLMSQS